MEVCSISSQKAMHMVERHHYSHRRVGAKYAFGLRVAGDLVGCVTYSQPASYTLCNGVCGPELRQYVLELSRLVILTTERNAASRLIGGSLTCLGDSVVVSYADCNEHVGHVGYVYQATNWLYTGQGTAEPVWINPSDGTVISYTRRHIDKKAVALGLHWQDLVRRPQAGKHRYVTFTGDRRFKRRARRTLRYPIMPYPKGATRRHDGEATDVGGMLAFPE